MSVNRTVRKALCWLVAVLWMGVIFYLSAQPDLPHHPEAALDVVIKKLGHVTEYGVLAALAWWALRDDRDAASWRAFLLAFGVAALYAISDETHQYFVPGRNPQPVDVGFDVAGAALSMLVIRRVLHIAELRRVR
jgi:VanZ family protein